MVRVFHASSNAPKVNIWVNGEVAAEMVDYQAGDQAGIKAAWRAADLALTGLKPGRTVRFAVLPEGKDPDDGHARDR